MPQLKKDERVRHLVIFGRLLNALRQLQLNFLDAASGDTPSDTGQRIGAFLFVASTLHEGLILLGKIGKTFRVLESWQNEMVPILRNPGFKTLRGSLQSVRNQSVFHFDKDSFLEPLARCDDDEAVIVAGRGPQAGGVYFPLSDLMAMALLTGPCSSGEEQENRFRELLTETRELLIGVVNVGEGVVTEYCRTKNFTEEVQVDGEWRAV